MKILSISLNPQAWFSEHSIQPRRYASNIRRWSLVAFFQDRPEVSYIVDFPILEDSIELVSFSLSDFFVVGCRNAR